MASFSRTDQGQAPEPIAIVGLAARVPGATSAAAFWDLLLQGRSARSKVPADRFNVDAFYHADPNRVDSTNVRHGHFLEEDIAAFDAPFFSIQPKEAISMDPQQRLVLETSYHALENAGMPMQSVAGSSTAVYIGTSSRDYESVLVKDAEQPSKYIGTGIGTSLIANRVSWFFDLKGPSLAVDTGCSASLVALHHACRAIRDGEVACALVGGVSLILSPDVSLIHLSNMGFFSPEGYCFSFDERANGYSKGEGVAMVVLTTLSAAIRDGNTIRAVIRGTSCNQDGHTPGLTMPSIDAQVANIQAAYRQAGLGLELGATGFFEAHGTGTQVGDTVEAEAIHRVFQRPPDNPLYVGALKSNIGHLEAASGVAGLIKCVLALEHGVMPPNRNFRRVNPKINLEQWGLKFPLQPTPWPTAGLRRVSLNSFGYGGTNSHVVLDDAASALEGYRGAKHNTAGMWKRLGDSVTVKTDTPQPHMLVFSAADQTALNATIASYATHFANNLPPEAHQDPSAYLASLSHTLSTHRSKLPWKTFTIARSLEDLQGDFAAQTAAPVRAYRKAGVIMVFSGQGAQYAQMGLELLSYPVFRTSMEQARDELKSLGCQWDLMCEIAKPEAESRIDAPLYSQAGCTALQLALVDLLASWSVAPDAVVGHSSGEIAAAYAAGALDHAQALRVAYYRGVVADRLARDLDKSQPCAMASIALSPDEIAPLLEPLPHVQIGCVNSPGNVTVTGEARSIDALNCQMEERRVSARKLAVTVPYHSAFMGLVADEYHDLLHDFASGAKNTKPNVRIFSSVSGQEIDGETLRRPQYWVENLTSKVLFLDAIKAMLAATGKDLYTGQPLQLLEVGPHAVLKRPIKDILAHLQVEDKFDYESLIFRGKPAVSTALNTVGRLWCKNVDIDVARVRYDPSQAAILPMLLDLPSYPFNHATRYWHEGRLGRNYRFRKFPRHDFLGTAADDWNAMEPRWRNMVRLAEHPWLLDHVIRGEVVYPPAAMLVLAIEAVRQLHEYRDEEELGSFEVTDVEFIERITIPEEPGEIETQIQLRQSIDADTSSHAFTIYTFVSDKATLLCRGTVRSHASACLSVAEGSRQMQYFQTRHDGCRERVDASQYYGAISDMGYGFGPVFQRMPYIEYNEADRFAVAPVSLISSRDSSTTPCQRSVIHPVDLESALHVAFAAISSAGTVNTPLLNPARLERLWISNGGLAVTRTASVLAEMTARGTIDAEFSLLAVNDETRAPVLQVEGLRQTAGTAFDAIPMGDEEEQAPVKRLAFQFSWKPDPGLLTVAETKDVLLKAVPADEAPSGEDEDFQELLAFHYVGIALKELSDDDVTRLPEHLQKYMAWAKHIYSQEKYERLLALFPEFANHETRKAFEDAGAQRSAGIELHVETGRWLMSILRGERDALDLLFKSGLAARYYAENDMFAANYKMLGAYLDLLAHKNPELRILEVGAGTGGATKPVMSIISSDNAAVGVSRFSEYMYTDVSPVFFEQAKELFAPHLSRMRFQVLDIEKDVLAQTLTAGNYDVVLCSGVLHISKAMGPTMLNIRKLLKPGGKLVQFEPSNPDACRAGFTFGLLKDWWVSREEHRRFSPLISDAVWDTTLRECGYSGADICIRSFAEPERCTHSILISTRQEEEEEARDGDGDGGVDGNGNLVIVAETDMQTEVARSIEQAVGHCYATTTVLPFEAISASSETTYIFLLELEGSWLRHIGEAAWDTLKAIMDATMQIVWVTRDGSCSAPADPDMSIVTGFGRSMMTEKLGIHFLELGLSAGSNVQHTSERVTQVLLRRLSERANTGDSISETEYNEDDKRRLCIGRLVVAAKVNRDVHAQTVRCRPVSEALGGAADCERRLKLAIATPGKLESLYFSAESSSSSGDLRDDEVLVRVEAISVNARDVQIALGSRSGSDFGLECAGTVTATGSGAASALAIGDRVIACLPSGAAATTVRVRAVTVAKFSEKLSFSQAAAMPVAIVTAHHGLVNVDNLQAGDSVLVAPGCTATGRLAIQIAQQREAVVYAAVRDETERSELMAAFGLPEGHVFLADSPTLAADVLAASSAGMGMDLIFSALRSTQRTQALRAVAPFGRFVDISGETETAMSELKLNNGNKSYATVDYVQLIEAFDPRGLRQLVGVMDDVAWYMLQDRIWLPKPRRCFNATELPTAFAYVNENLHRGAKAIVEFGANDVVRVAPSLCPPPRFSPAATYIIGGGNGGIGRAIATWLASNGARHILILSRSGARKPACTTLISDLTAKGIDIRAPPCDLADRGAVQAILENTINTTGGCMPPVAGVIQATMVLREGILQNLSVTDWHAALAPKVQGTWNLHSLLPHNLDFFICLSSVAGITGCRSQASYNAACTYQDALCRYRRRTLGERATSFNLGVIVGVGWAAETDGTEMLRREGYLGMSKQVFLRLLGRCVSGDEDQVISGLEYMNRFDPVADARREIYWARNPNCAVLRQINAFGSTSSTSCSAAARSQDARALLAAASTSAAKTALLLQLLQEKLASLFNVANPSDIDASMPLSAIGIDSLVALEVRYWFAKVVGVDVGMDEILRDWGVGELVAWVGGKLRGE